MTMLAADEAPLEGGARMMGEDDGGGGLNRRGRADTRRQRRRKGANDRRRELIYHLISWWRRGGWVGRGSASVRRARSASSSTLSAVPSLCRSRTSGSCLANAVGVSFLAQTYYLWQTQERLLPVLSTL
eukprot:CAMPEP_0170145332 /NCGR_PEP_ID=MMETSP0033_2-20121228/16617_1 /TAXON_ID=195969 /ORGANISM="Dolichomastix tenuilepis, Strain CCMP3274" /LENGTH=128 /DNA_ID=CAMNT_0010381877 /DNA_START=1 /DNA_END=384 /DNA_ORIENTATION=-